MGLRWRWILEAGELEMENWSCGPGRSLGPHYRGVRRHRENDAKLAKLHLTVRDDSPAPSHLGKDTLKTFTTRHPTGRRGLVKTQLSLDPWTPRSGQSLLGIAHPPSTNRHIHNPYHIRIVTPPPSSLPPHRHHAQPDKRHAVLPPAPAPPPAIPRDPSHPQEIPIGTQLGRKGSLPAIAHLAAEAGPAATATATAPTAPTATATAAAATSTTTTSTTTATTTATDPPPDRVPVAKKCKRQPLATTRSSQQ